MTALNSYSTGTVAVSADGTTVTGTSTIWSSAGNVKPGDLFQSGHFLATITDVTDDTHLVITPWPGSTVSGASYTIWKVSQQRIVGETYARSVDQLVSAMDTSGFFVFVNVNQTTPDPSLGDDGQYAFQPTTGKTWAKVGGVWTYLGIYKAFQLKGAWSGATAYAAGDVVTLSGSSYVCVLDHTNHTPPNATYWQLLASKGDPGTNGTNGSTGATGATGAGYGGTSTTSLAIGTGSKVFTTQAGLAYTNGARVRATATAGVTGWLEGVATYSGTTLTITSDKTSGSGTGTAWNFNLAGEPGAGDLSSANNLSDVANAATAAANLAGC
ncbi:carbohydrate-binding protein [Bradyrhizobium sp. S3.7.6]